MIAGVALLGLSMASSAEAGSGMQLTTVTSLNGFVNNGGSVTTTAAISSPTTSTYQYLTTSDPAWNGTIDIDYKPAYAVDMVLFSLEGPSAHSTWIGSGSLSVTFSAAVKFIDMAAAFTGFSGNWTHNASPIAQNQVFSAGSYTFDFSFSYPNNPQLVAGIFVGFQAASPGGGGGGVPLPGAAGLAACGLLGLSRRRRR